MAKKTKRTTKHALKTKGARRPRGGQEHVDTERLTAATKQNGRAKKTLGSTPAVRGRAGAAMRETDESSASPETNGHATHNEKPNKRLRGRKSNGRATVVLKPVDPAHGQAAGEGEDPADSVQIRADTCCTLQSLQRRRAAAIKSRVAMDNQLGAIVATELGYYAGMTEADRKALRGKADAIVAAVRTMIEAERTNGKKPNAKTLAKRTAAKELLDANASIVAFVSPLVIGFEAGRETLAKMEANLEDQMTQAVGTLRAAKWAESVKGFGLMRLAVVIGETGDLSSYANPGKVWKRMGCAPFNGKMPSTWRFGKEGKLSAEEWTEIGYSPRRRAIMFVISDLLVKLNFETPEGGETAGEPEISVASSGAKTPGPYRARYDEAKAKKKAERPDWSDARVNNHGHLLCAKRLLRDLWIEWNKQQVPPSPTPKHLAGVK